jgi:glycosyltransferase involved in cell wall biosynthesis
MTSTATCPISVCCRESHSLAFRTLTHCRTGIGEVSIDARQSVLLLLPASEPGVEGAAPRALAVGLPSEEFRVTVGVLGSANAADYDELSLAGIAVKPLPIRHMMDVSGTRRMRQFVRECQPGILHTWGAVAARAARRLVSNNGPGGNWPRLVISSASMPGGGLRGWLTARGLRSADRVMPTTRADGDRYRRLGVPAEQLTLIAPAAPHVRIFPDSDSASSELRLPPGAQLIVADGRSEKGFGPRDAIIAFDMLRYDLKNLHLAIRGAGPETHSLERFARSLAFDDFRVHFVPRGAADAAFRLADAVFVTRPQSGVEDALEAMAAGKAVIGWGTADIAEIVEDKMTGLLVNLGDRAALAASMRAVLENPSYARRLGDAGRTRAGERFGRSRMIEQFVRLYRELIPLRCTDRPERL